MILLISYFAAIKIMNFNHIMGLSYLYKMHKEFQIVFSYVKTKLNFNWLSFYCLNFKFFD